MMVLGSFKQNYFCTLGNPSVTFNEDTGSDFHSRQHGPRLVNQISTDLRALIMTAER